MVNLTNGILKNCYEKCITVFERVIDCNQNRGAEQSDHPVLNLVDYRRIEHDVVAYEVQKRERAVDINDFDDELNPPIDFILVVEHCARNDCHRSEIHNVAHNLEYVARNQERQSCGHDVRKHRRKVVLLRKRDHKRDCGGNKKSNRAEFYDDAEPNHQQSHRRAYAGESHAVDRLLS